jgi:hypothetical protein
MQCPRGDLSHTRTALTATVTAQDASSLVVGIDLMSLVQGGQDFVDG